MSESHPKICFFCGNQSKIINTFKYPQIYFCIEHYEEGIRALGQYLRLKNNLELNPADIELKKFLEKERLLNDVNAFLTQYVKMYYKIERGIINEN